MKLIRLLFGLLILGMAILFGGLVIYWHQSGDRLFSVQSNSMVPAFKHGDALLTKYVPLSELRLNDVISYRSPADNRVVVTHRLIEINYKTGRMVTIGDNNTVNDLAFPASQYIGKIYKIFPKAGLILDWFHSLWGLVFVLYLPGIILIFLETKRLSRKINNDRLNTFYSQYR